jgi:hypothetical protein
LADLDAATKEFQAALAKANGNAPTTTTSPKPTG